MLINSKTSVLAILSLPDRDGKEQLELVAFKDLDHVKRHMQRNGTKRLTLYSLRKKSVLVRKDDEFER